MLTTLNTCRQFCKRKSTVFSRQSSVKSSSVSRPVDCRLSTVDCRLWTAPSTRAIGQFPQSFGAFDSFFLLIHSVERPGQNIRPVPIARRRRMVDAIAPAEDVLNGQEHQIGTGAIHGRQYGVADGFVER